MGYREDPPGLATARRGVHLPLLERLTVKTPCREVWARMDGDDKVRHCRVCDRQVFNTLAMTTAELEAMIAPLADGQRVCARLYQRPDGTLVTADCADARAARRALARTVAGVGAAVAASLAGVIALWPERGDRGAVPVSALPAPAPRVVHLPPPPEAVMPGTPPPPRSDLVWQRGAPRPRRHDVSVEVVLGDL